MEKISEAEYEIMQAVWQSAGSVMPTELYQQIGQNKNWKYSTLRSFLARLTKKGLLECESGRINRYRAIVSEQEYKHFETKNFIDTIHQGSLRSMLTALCNDKIPEQKLSKLMKEIESMQEEQE